MFPQLYFDRVDVQPVYDTNRATIKVWVKLMSLTARELNYEWNVYTRIRLLHAKLYQSSPNDAYKQQIGWFDNLLRLFPW